MSLFDSSYICIKWLLKTSCTEVRKILFVKEINNFIQQGCIKMIKNNI